ncbi:MAG: hypothetical protein IPP71_06675 [Bacteroidetes bacterium]|nr:hypothetical protein [Bacteroidota bacterium]
MKSKFYFFRNICTLLIFVVGTIQESKSQQLSYNGHSYPVNTNGTSIRVMMAFAELLGPCAPNDQTNWTYGNLPINVDDFLTQTSPPVQIRTLIYQGTFGNLHLEN